MALQLEDRFCRETESFYAFRLSHRRYLCYGLNGKQKQLIKNTNY